MDESGALGPGLSDAMFAVAFDLGDHRHRVIADRSGGGWTFDHTREHRSTGSTETFVTGGSIDPVANTVTAMVPLEQIPGASPDTQLEVTSILLTQRVDVRPRYLVSVSFRATTPNEEGQAIA